jgi:phospholipase C
VDTYGEGFRVPTLVISPWAKHHLVDHTQYEFASLLRLAEVNFRLPVLGSRDVTSNDMMNSFDFLQAPQPEVLETAAFIGPGTSPPPTVVPTEISTSSTSTVTSTVTTTTTSITTSTTTTTQSSTNTSSEGTPPLIYVGLAATVVGLVLLGSLAWMRIRKPPP